MSNKSANSADLVKKYAVITSSAINDLRSAMAGSGTSTLAANEQLASAHAVIESQSKELELMRQENQMLDDLQKRTALSALQSLSKGLSSLNDSLSITFQRHADQMDKDILSIQKVTTYIRSNPHSSREVDHLKEENAHLSSENKKLSEATVNSQKDLKLREQLQSLQSQNKALSDKHSEIERENLSLHALIDSERIRSKHLEEQKGAVESRLNEVMQKIQRSEEGNLKSQVASMEREKADLIQSIADLKNRSQAELKEATDDAKSALSLVRNLQDELETNRKTIIDLKTANRSLSASIDALRMQVNTLSSKNEQLESSLKKEVATGKSSKEVILQLTKENSNATASLRTMKKQMDDAMTPLFALLGCSSASEANQKIVTLLERTIQMNKISQDTQTIQKELEAERLISKSLRNQITELQSQKSYLETRSSGNEELKRVQGKLVDVQQQLTRIEADLLAEKEKSRREEEEVGNQAQRNRILEQKICYLSSQLIYSLSSINSRRLKSITVEEIASQRVDDLRESVIRESMESIDLQSRQYIEASSTIIHMFFDKLEMLNNRVSGAISQLSSIQGRKASALELFEMQTRIRGSPAPQLRSPSGASLRRTPRLYPSSIEPPNPRGGELI